MIETPHQLTPQQHALMTAELTLYFDGWQQRGFPFLRPTFRAEKRWENPDNLPDGVSAGRIARHSTGAVSDPTFQQAMERLYGPRKVAVWCGIREPVEALWFTRFATLLPAHLAAVYDRVLLKRQILNTLAPEVQIGRNVLARYRDDALNSLIAALFDNGGSSCA